MPPFDFTVEVEFYEEDGIKPVAAFLRDLKRSNPEAAARAARSLKRLEDGRYHIEPHTKDVGDGLHELRLLGRDGVRILFFFARDRRIVVVHGFLKKTQEIPRRERSIALERKRRYERRAAKGAFHEE